LDLQPQQQALYKYKGANDELTNVAGVHQAGLTSLSAWPPGVRID
jgi:hypothetical protein